MNRLLSAANSALYGICHAVIAGIGASPALGFVHTGSALSFVLDVADLYKAEFTIPLAFDLTAKGMTAERDARTALRDVVVEGRLLPRIIADIKDFLVPAGTNLADEDLQGLWGDDADTIVSGGRNWGDALTSGEHLTMIPPPPQPDEKDGGPVPETRE